MIIKSFPLIRPGVFAIDFRILDSDSSKILVKPDFLSICAADLRYYLGLRPGNILNKKLPMVLVHEAIGTIVSSSNPCFEIGAKVILLPCGVNASIDSNYAPNAFFRSSNADGFCQELVSLEEAEIIKISKQEEAMPFVFSELLSVCFQAIRQIQNEIKESSSIAVWGDGSLGYLMSLILSEEYPEKEITVIGKHEDKLEKFTFADHIETIFNRSNKLFDLMIECVGGNGSQNAIADMITSSNPKATILLTGVSENPPAINTRSILERGLTLKGTTRSVREDFIRANHFLEKDSNRKKVSYLLSEVVSVHNVNELKTAFEKACSSQFKTVISFAP
jgi:ribitol-5-phosphate 2-dehydrogenase